MSFISIPKTKFKKPLKGDSSGFSPNSMIDLLFDYGAFLNNADSQGSICSVPPSSANKVAVIGGGGSGLVTTYELSRVTNIDVTLFEASNRLGGRMYSIVTEDPGYNSKIFEMGCMRYPPTSHTLFHYLSKFGLAPEGQFPDPGKVLTNLYYENQEFLWKEGESAPENPDFQRIGQDFSSMLLYLLGDAGNPNLVAPEKLYDFWAIYQANPTDENKSNVVAIWQSIIDQYESVTYYDAVFTLAQNTSVVQQAWTVEDMNKFGALGVGSGGFGPLYAINFVDILRLFANGWEDDQQFLEQGIYSLVERFAENMEGQVGIKLETPINSIVKIDSGQYMLNNDAGMVYDAVVVATTTRAMEYMGLTLSNLVDQGSKVAMRNLHLMNSSKLFVLTKKKFWYKENNSFGVDLPSNIQTDELLRGLYCLDYDESNSGAREINGYGVVLISYVWGDDSSKLLAMSPHERFDCFAESLKLINNDFYTALMESVGVETITSIDWENTPNYYGAFKLNYPGQGPVNRDAFFQFQNESEGLFLAGDSVSWAGGWLEGALPTGVNAACAVTKFLGGEVMEGSPMGIPSNMYDYDNPPA